MLPSLAAVLKSAIQVIAGVGAARELKRSSRTGPETLMSLMSSAACAFISDCPEVPTSTGRMKQLFKCTKDSCVFPLIQRRSFSCVVQATC